MYDGVFLTINSLIVLGALFLAASLIPISKLIRQLPSGKMRLQWKILTALILAFIVSMDTENDG